MCVDFAPVIDVQWLNAPLPVRTSVGDVESSVDVLHVVDVCLRYKDTATYRMIITIISFQAILSINLYMYTDGLLCVAFMFIHQYCLLTLP